MNRRFVTALLSMLLVSCSHEPPAYESKYVAPTTTSVQRTASLPPTAPIVPPRTPVTATYFDNFDRPDTQQGLGEGWTTRGRDPLVDPDANSFPLPEASDGYIHDGRFTYSGRSMVYAIRQFRGVVNRMGAVGRWRQIGSGAETTLAMGISSNDLVVADMIHFVANRSSWKLTFRRGGGAFEPILSGRFSPVLELDREYQFEIEATDNSVTVRVPGTEASKDVSTVGLLGDRAFWEQYPNGAPVGTVLDIDAVWADAA